MPSARKIRVWNGLAAGTLAVCMGFTANLWAVDPATGAASPSGIEIERAAVNSLAGGIVSDKRGGAGVCGGPAGDRSPYARSDARCGRRFRAGTRRRGSYWRRRGGTCQEASRTRWPTSSACHFQYNSRLWHRAA